MKHGSKACPFCGSRFTFEDFELVDSMPAEQPCEGCERLYAILAESAKVKAEQKAETPEAEPVDLSSPTAILARLLANRRGAAEPERDYAKAAAGDRD